tara:strand:+ start:1411 stop:1521 length:111 start_codon:yes stop_codon:yes gene_type:complete
MTKFYTENSEKKVFKKAIAILLLTGSILLIEKWRNK